MRIMKIGLAASLLGLTMTGGGVAVSQADSCWYHNGSVVRLIDNGLQRQFIYEVPQGSLVNAGVVRGTLLFNGLDRGNYYAGTARVFSRFCPADPLEYYVEGPVTRNPLQVTLSGARDANRQCQRTGTLVHDTLVFTYLQDC